MRSPALLILILILIAMAGCGDDETPSNTDGGTVLPPPPPPPPPVHGFPEGNEWSWNGSWTPAEAEFPIAGLFDDLYGDGHAGDDGAPTPKLPPGEWDYQGSVLANWRNFSTNIGEFSQLMDEGGRHYGWQFVGKVADATDFAGAAAYWEGSPGTDELDLGGTGILHSYADGNLGDGPDVLILDRAFSLDFRTGSSLSGSLRDDDLVIAGCRPNTDGAFDFTTATIHTGPGHDWVFVRDLDRAGIDLGNGEGGRTDTIDPRDGNDLAVIRGNSHDFRIVGGRGDDVVVWYVDENVQTAAWLGPNFFGDGALGDAAFGDAGSTDRLVLAVPDETTLSAPDAETPPGAFRVRPTSGKYELDNPTASDPFATYCIECGMGPAGEKTVIIEYRSADGEVFTGFSFLTGFEELQIGVGDGARVYAIDSAAGTIRELGDAEAFDPPSPPPELCE